VYHKNVFIIKVTLIIVYIYTYTHTVKMNMLYLINKIVATDHKQYYLLN